ncbi:ATP-binding protein [Pseudonocardia sp. RS11V-5]|uniref:ATP-binding protein n=1 Tax=Pseudonocardia terrae TaxID=2905831 RepID=UPI001E559BFF|nr:ATP-binding protein [Pseudonocardia terrae]MCE3556443.1 ATP-binding protein [Pseudonocardia terrae]
MTGPVHGDGHDQPKLSAIISLHDSAAIVVFRGELAAPTGDQLRRQLGSSLTRFGPVVADIDDVVVRQSDLLTLFAEAVREAGGWPKAKLAILARHRHVREMLRASTVAQRVAVADDLDLAFARLGRRPELVDACWTVPPDPRRLAALRRELRARLEDWQFPGEIEDVTLVASELAANSIDHARTQFTVRLDLTADWLSVSVRDGSPTPPRQQPPDPRAHRGRGLQLIAALADTWDVHPHAGGKTVRAGFRTRADQPPSRPDA